MSDVVQETLTQLKGIRWIAYLVVFVLVIIGIANFTEAIRKLFRAVKDCVSFLRKQQLSDVALLEKARNTARGLAELVRERELREPAIDFENWHASTDAMIRHSQETQNLYVRDFASQVAHLREEFRKRGLREPNLDNFYEHPTNYIGMRMMATSLGKLAEDLASRRSA